MHAGQTKNPDGDDDDDDEQYYYYYNELCVLVYNCLHGVMPRYLQDVIQPVAEVTSRRRLRSASSSALAVPATRRSLLNKAHGTVYLS